jgi:hypothetical protein
MSGLQGHVPMNRITILLIVTCWFFSFAKNDPDQGAISFHLLCHISGVLGDLVNEEKTFVDKSGFSSIFRDSSGNLDTVKYSYRYIVPGLECSLGYCFADNISAGLNYNYENDLQALNWDTRKYHYNENTETLMELNRLGPFLEYWFFNKGIFDLSLQLPVQYAFGSLQRFPVINRAITEKPTGQQYFDNFVKSAHAKTGLNGFNISPSVNLRLYLGNFVFVLVGAKYDYSQLYISNNNLAGYPSVLFNHNIGLQFGFGLTTVSF